jgi:cystathionine beta-lyase/cystathionine gamma-synthase
MSNSEELKSAIASADIYRGVGTTFLHIHNPLDGENGAHNGSVDNSNPTGAVVPSISLATTFKQSTPGEASAKDDPNSFGLGFEYSRTGMWCANVCSDGSFIFDN